MDRRHFLGSSAAALLLPGCVTTAARPAARSGCLPPVLASPERVIRAVAGLRPYRASGFVVRAEALGDKRLVHNYGHGGAGITLSWGTSRLATLLGLQGRRGPVAVLGAGVMGLTTARLVQEAGFPVTIYTAELPLDTTSNLAGGQWGPTGHYRESAVTPEWRSQYKAALAVSWMARAAGRPSAMEMPGGGASKGSASISGAWRRSTRWSTTCRWTGWSRIPRCVTNCCDCRGGGSFSPTARGSTPDGCWTGWA